MKTLFPSFIFLCALSLLFSCKKEDVTTPVPVKEWHSVAPMPTSRYNFGLVECNGFLYAVGGYNTDGLHNVEAYDPSTNSWQPKAKMPTARGYLVVATVSNKIYAIGGISGSNLNDITYENVTEEYDPATNKWTKKAPFPAPYAYNRPLV